MSNEDIKQSIDTDEVSIRKNLIDTLTISLYEELVIFFNSILVSDSDYIVFIARKSYALFKAFEPLLCHDHGKVIFHDKLIALYIDEIQNDRKILIVDDTFIYGRGICSTIQSLINDFKIMPEKITFAVFVANELRLKAGSDVLNVIDDDTDFVRFVNSKNIALLPNTIFCDLSIIRGFSADFLKAIHAVSIPYVDYISAFWADYDGNNKAIIDTIISNKSVLKKGKKGKYQYANIMSPLLEKLEIFAFCIEIPLASKELFSYVRVYVNQRMKKITVVPHIIFPAIKNIGTCYENAKPLFPLPDISADIPKGQDSLIKDRVLHYVTSCTLGKYFSELTGLVIEPVSQGPRSDDIIKNIMQCESRKPKAIFEAISPVINSSITDSNKNEQIIVDSFKMAGNENTDSNIFRILSWFLLVGINKDASSEPKSEGILISYLVEKIREKVGGRPKETNAKIYRAITRLCDLGRAVTQVASVEDGTIACFVQYGEQAVQGITDCYMGSFAFCIGQIYRRFKDDWEQIKENLFCYLEQVINAYKLNIPLGVLELIVNYSKDNQKEFNLKPDEFMLEDLIINRNLANINPEYLTGIMFFQALILYYPAYLHTIKGRTYSYTENMAEFKKFLSEQKMGVSEYRDILFACFDQPLNSRSLD